MRKVVAVELASVDGVMESPEKWVLSYSNDEMEKTNAAGMVACPVSDVDRANSFYFERLGFIVDLGIRIGDGSRLVQLTSAGSACSIHLNTMILAVKPGSAQGLHLVVANVEAARRTRRTRSGCQRNPALRFRVRRVSVRS